MQLSYYINHSSGVISHPKCNKAMMINNQLLFGVAVWSFWRRPGAPKHRYAHTLHTARVGITTSAPTQF